MSPLEKIVSDALEPLLAKGILLRCVRTPEGQLLPPLSVGLRLGPFSLPQLREMGFVVAVTDDKEQPLSDDQLAAVILAAEAYRDE